MEMESVFHSGLTGVSSRRFADFTGSEQENKRKQTRAVSAYVLPTFFSHGIRSADAEKELFQAAPDSDPSRLAVTSAAKETSQHGQ